MNYYAGNSARSDYQCFSHVFTVPFVISVQKICRYDVSIHHIGGKYKWFLSGKGGKIAQIRIFILCFTLMKRIFYKRIGQRDTYKISAADL